MKMTQAVTSINKQRPHLNELDRLRIITALAVVAVHTLGNTTPLDHTGFALELQNAFVAVFHFTREVFMFVTALALVYVYFGKPFDTRRFWKKRAIGVLIPYLIWSLVYVLANNHFTTFSSFLGVFLSDVVTGSASYQLYYILLTLEFYLIFPWFLRILPALARHPWVTLSVSAAVELLILVGDHHFLHTLPLSSAQVNFISVFVARFALTYQFYFVLGALVALNLSRVQVFVTRHGVWMALAGLLGLAALEGQYVYDVNIRHIPISAAVDVLQPIMIVYSLGSIAFLYWLTYTQSQRAAQHGNERARRVWAQLSDASFGVYLVHPLFLTALLRWVAPQMTGVPTAITVATMWVLTASGAVASTLLLLRIPLLSRTVGRALPPRPRASGETPGGAQGAHPRGGVLSATDRRSAMETLGSVEPAIAAPGYLGHEVRRVEATNDEIRHDMRPAEERGRWRI